MQSEESDVAMVFSVSIKQFDALAPRRLSLCSLRFRRENRLAFFIAQNDGMAVNYRGKKVLYHWQLEAAQPPAVKEM